MTCTDTFGVDFILDSDSFEAGKQATLCACLSTSLAIFVCLVAASFFSCATSFLLMLFVVVFVVTFFAGLCCFFILKSVVHSKNIRT